MPDLKETRWAARLAALDANLLVALDAILQEVNVTRAAARVGVTQSAMSQTLARLRDHFDDPILVRVGREMQPTPFAMRIRGRLHEAINALEAVLRDRPQFDPKYSTRRFVIASVDYLALLLFSPLHQALRAEGESLELALHALQPGTMTPELAAGHIDLYLGVSGDTERGLRRERLYGERLQVVARSDHPRLSSLDTLRGLSQCQHLLVSPRREAGSVLSRAMKDAGLERRVAVEVPYFALVPDLLRGSDLVAVIPARLAQAFAQQHGLWTAELEVALPEIEICMAWHPTFENEPGLRWLREVVANVAAHA